MNEADNLKSLIHDAFANLEYPGDWCLRAGNEGDEPLLVERDFKGKTDWRILDPSFIDQAPAGFGSALSFFSDEAFRFYLPAYLIAHIDGSLERSDPVFHLCYGLDDATRDEKVNTFRFGERTWFDEATHKFAHFTNPQAAAIVAYLKFIREREEFEQNTIDEALSNYWFGRVGLL